MAKKKTDPATLILLGVYYAYDGNVLQISDIDPLIEIAEKFEVEFGGTNWEKSGTDWETAVSVFYNKNKPSHFKD